ncbi:MAG: hypothetical protein ABI480_09880 [Chitinophagaceae bacterium]
MKSLAKKSLLLSLLVCFTLISWAQDKKVDIDINLNKHKEWYQQPWAWVVGGAVFILILVALLRPRQKQG